MTMTEQEKAVCWDALCETSRETGHYLLLAIVKNSELSVREWRKKKEGENDERSSS